MLFLPLNQILRGDEPLPVPPQIRQEQGWLLCAISFVGFGEGARPRSGQGGWGRGSQVGFLNGVIMPPRRTIPKGYEHARQLRKEPTPAERKLWARLRNAQLLGVNFRRQHAIGQYVPDFCSPKMKLIIELDGSQHLELQDYDAQRTEYFESRGYKVIRFWNQQVMNDIEGILRQITAALLEPRE